MDYYGLLFLYYLKGLSGKSILRLFFNIEAGGTEQLLPENTSAPTTTPILADIQYPDGLRTDQYFTYRETPTTVSNKARIKTIKGNTLVWNQLSQSTRVSGSAYGLSITCTDGLWSFQGTYTGTDGAAFRCGTSYVPIPAGHKVLLLNTSPWKVRLQGGYTPTSANTPQNRIIEAASDTLADIVVHAYGLSSGDTVDVQYRFGIFDLTVMFGDTLANAIYAMEQATEGSGIAYFKSFFPLDYYSYNSGSLIPFMGNGIKTVGKNLLMPSTVPWSDVSYVDGYYEYNLTASSATERRLFGNWGIQNAVSLGLTSGTYIWTAERLGINASTVLVRVSVHGTESYVTWSEGTSRYINSDDKFFILLYFGSAGTYNGKVGIQLEFGSNATSYEPYTESVINLPISTYFPTGMKSAGTVYDELIPRKAITRIGAIDLGTLDWTTYSSPERHIFRAYILSDMKEPNGANLPNAMCSRYEPMAYTPISANDDGYFAIGAQRIVIIEHDYTDPVAFKESLSNVYLYYELATPTETPITTEDANEALSLLMGKSVSSNNANQLINIITKGE